MPEAVITAMRHSEMVWK